MMLTAVGSNVRNVAQFAFKADFSVYAQKLNLSIRRSGRDCQDKRLK